MLKGIYEVPNFKRYEPHMENRIERMAKVSDVQLKEVRAFLKTLKEFEPNLKELCETYEAAKKYNLRCSKYGERQERAWQVSFERGKSVSVSLDTRHGNGTYEKYYIDKNCDVYTSDYNSTCRTEDGHVEYSSTFRCCGYKSGDLNTQFIRNLKYVLSALYRFEKDFYDDIDEQILELERQNEQ